MRLREFANTKLLELNDTDAGGMPPVALGDDGPGRGPRGGKVWFNAERQKIAVPGQGGGMPVDFAVMPFLMFEQFGFEPRRITSWLDSMHPREVQTFERFVAATMPSSDVDVPDDNYQESLRKDTNMRASIFNHLGARTASLHYGLSHGWSFIEFDESHCSIWLDNKHASAIVKAAGSMFPLMSMDTIRVAQMNLGNGGFGKVFNLDREDTPGFSGAFGALMQWAKDGTIPTQDWLYTVVPHGSEDRVDSSGLHAEAGRMVNIGNATYRNQYVLPFNAGMTAKLMMRNSKGTIYRFPASALAAYDVRQGGDSVPVLFSKSPFVVSASVVQRRSGSGWVPLAEK